MIKGVSGANVLRAALKKMRAFPLAAFPLAIVTACFSAGAAYAIDGQPEPWQLSFQPAATEIARQIDSLHDFLLYLCIIVAAFVLFLLIWVMIKFNAKANPEPSKTTHNSLLEVAWTVVPILILVAVAIPSFRLLYAQYSFPKPDVTIKAIGNQWYWTYEYPDNGGMTFDSVMLEDNELKEGQPRLLAVDNDVVVPVNKVVQVLVTASDVIHNWTIPAFGSKIDAVPGRITRTWFKAERTGVFYGQCSELCGIKHAFMPITVRVVSEEEYAKWLVKAKKQFASNRTLPVNKPVQNKALAGQKLPKANKIAENQSAQ